VKSSSMKPYNIDSGKCMNLVGGMEAYLEGGFFMFIRLHGFSAFEVDVSRVQRQIDWVG